MLLLYIVFLFISYETNKLLNCLLLIFIKEYKDYVYNRIMSETIPMPKQVSIDIGDIYEQCGELDKKENSTYLRSKCKVFYCNGMDYNYNLCCIRFFIKKALLNYEPTEPTITLNTGVRFCQECSETLLEDKLMLKTLYDLTNDDKTKKQIKKYSIEINGVSVLYIL